MDILYYSKRRTRIIENEHIQEMIEATAVGHNSREIIFDGLDTYTTSQSSEETIVITINSNNSDAGKQK